MFQIHIQIHSLKFMFQQNELEYHLKKRKHPVIYIIKYLEYYRIKMLRKKKKIEIFFCIHGKEKKNL